MAASYLQRGMGGEATFSLFIRQLPPTRGFLVAAGLEPALDFLEGFGLSEPELDYLGTELGFEDPVLDALGALRFTGEVWAVPEGRVVYANEPLLEITAPIAVAQLVEPYLLNQITFQTTIASKAARCVLAADGRDVVDFALRRTQGLDAALAVARCSAIVGFAATSNVEAARRYELRPAGTMAHSYIESFPSEKEAFRTFARDFPGRTTFLVDTYDTLNGVRTAIEVIQELGLTDNLAVRLDSGDLDELSRGARALLDEAGLQRRPDLRERRPRRVPAPPSGRRRRADRRVRRRDPDGGLGGRALAGLGVQARRVRRPSDAQALGAQGDRARPQAGVPGGEGRRHRPARRAAAGRPRAAARPGDEPRPKDRPSPNARDRANALPERSRTASRRRREDRGPGGPRRPEPPRRSTGSPTTRRPTPSSAPASPSATRGRATRACCGSAGRGSRTAPRRASRR